MDLNSILTETEQKLAAMGANSEREFAALKTYLFGKSGVLTELMKSLKDLPDRKSVV